MKIGEAKDRDELRSNRHVKQDALGASMMSDAMIDRQAASRALAKVIAHKECGNELQADEWAAELVRLLQRSGILKRGWKGGSHK